MKRHRSSTNSSVVRSSRKLASALLAVVALVGVGVGGLQTAAPTEAATVCLDNTLEYRVHMANIGWGPWVKNGAVAGTTGQSRRVEAVQIKSTCAYAYAMVYAHVQNYGWDGPWETSNNIACRPAITLNAWTGSSLGCVGTQGRSLRLEALQFRLQSIYQRTNINGIRLCMQAHLAYTGWQSARCTSYVNPNFNDYSSTVMVGTTGESRQIEAISMWFETR